MGETLGVLAAILSSSLGGTAIAVTRYVVGATDPITLGAIRFCLGAVFLAPVVWLSGQSWPKRRDWPGVAALGLLFFGLFPVLFNLSVVYTTAARASLALATMPLLTMVAAAVLRVEKLTLRKSIGVFLAIAGVATALVTGLESAPPGAWRGDLIMVAGACCMALYGVWSRPYIARSGPIPFAAAGMAVGGVCLALLSWAQGGLHALANFGTSQWLAAAYLGTVGSALIFYLWAFALGRTTPTRVAISVCINPVFSSVLAAVLIGEAIGANLLIGLVAIAAGILVASTGKERGAK